MQNSRTPEHTIPPVGATSQAPPEYRGWTVHESIHAINDGKYSVKITTTAGDDRLPASQIVEVINTETGVPIPDDEPLFILRGQDKLALGAIMEYSVSVDDEDHAARSRESANRFKAFAVENPDRMKMPD